MEQLLQTQYVLKKGVHVSGDGLSDSPGFSAKYNTYSFMEDTTKEIILFELVQVTEASSSAATESVGFRRGPDYLLEQGVEVEVVTTDRSPSIQKSHARRLPRHTSRVRHLACCQGANEETPVCVQQKGQPRPPTVDKIHL